MSASAKWLRRAATDMRHNTYNGQSDDAPFMEAVADSLDLAAQWIERHPDSRPPWVHASLAVADAYLGDQP